MLRVYGIGCEQVVDRQHELEWLARLSQMSTAVGPQLLATFGNGRFEEYLDSVTLTHDDLRDPETSKQIARSLRELHRVADIYPPSSENIRVELWRNVSKWYAVVRELLNQQVWQQKLKDCNMQTLPSEIERCKAVLDKVPSKIVFAHNDVSISFYQIFVAVVSSFLRCERRHNMEMCSDSQDLESSLLSTLNMRDTIHEVLISRITFASGCTITMAKIRLL